MRVSVSEVLQVYFIPDEFTPVAPTGAQNAPDEIVACEGIGERVGVGFGVAGLLISDTVKLNLSDFATNVLTLFMVSITYKEYSLLFS